MKHFRGYLHSYNEASLIVHAVRLGIIEPVQERLSASDRDKITSGCIYVFIEDISGIKRWTDGKIWSPSKILGHFLLYKEVPKHLSKSSLKKRSSSSKFIDKFPVIKEENPHDEFCLYKKTISIKHEKKSYHIISYFMPVFDRRGIIEFPFFRCLNTVLIEYSELLSDRFVDDCFTKNISIPTKYNILPFRDKNIIPDYDRTRLERIACQVLDSKFSIFRNER